MPWYTKASLPAARYWAAGYDISGIGYVVGGNSGSGASKNKLCLQPSKRYVGDEGSASQQRDTG
jgi:hypothetical protein